jgi:hypothetical protein
MAGHKYYKRGRGSANQRAAWQAQDLDDQWKRENPGKMNFGDKFVFVLCLIIVFIAVMTFFS